MRTREKEKSLSVLIGEADKVFSEYIRLRDTHNGIIRCFICGINLRFKEAQNMHFIDRDQMPVRFDEINCHAGCDYCNCYDLMHKEKYESAMMNKYGEQTLDTLFCKSKGLQKFMRYEVEELITHYRSRVSELKKV